jgi:arsenate reductase
MSTEQQPPVNDIVALEHQLVLRSTSALLQREFEGIFGAETIELFLNSSYDEFATRSTNQKYLPVFAERFARERLGALARVEGSSTDARPAVLFLCTHNAGRSQIALGYFRALAGDRAVAWSGGSEPGDQVNPAAIEAMIEVGIDISGEFPKPWTDEVVRAADVVVTMGCGDACPIFPGKRYEDWSLTDPNGLGIESVRPIRDDIRTRVEALLTSLGIEPATN